MPTQVDQELAAMRAQAAAVPPAPVADGSGMTQVDQDLAALRAPTAQLAAPQGGVSRFDRFMKGLNDVSTAGAQLAVHALPNGVVDAVNNATSKVNSLPVIGPITQALGMVPANAKSLDADIKQGERTYQAARGPDAGIDWMRGAGNVVGSAPLAALAPASTGIVGGAVLGGVSAAATQPVTNVGGSNLSDVVAGNDGPGFWEQKAKQAAIGAVTGGAVTGAVNGIARIISPKISPEVRTLMDAGVTPTPGQIMGGGFKRAEEGATSIPVIGDMVRNAQRRSVQQLNTAAINRALSPIGEQLPAGMAGREAIGDASTKIGAAYDDVLSRIGAVKPDMQMVNELANLSGLTSNLAKDKGEQFNRIIDNEILGRIDGHGMMTGEGVKAAEGNLGGAVRDYLKSNDYDTRQLGAALQEAQTSVRQMLQRTAPAESQRLGDINQAYANLLRPQTAAARVGSDGGIFTADQLQSAVRELDPSKRKAAFAKGEALMQDLSEAGKSVLGNKLPDSGTPFRHAIGAAGAALVGHSMLPEGAAALMAPAALVGGAAALPYTAVGQKLAAALLASRPAGAQLTAEQIKRLAPYLAVGAVPPALAATK